MSKQKNDEANKRNEERTFVAAYDAHFANDANEAVLGELRSLPGRRDVRGVEPAHVGEEAALRGGRAGAAEGTRAAHVRAQRVDWRRRPARCGAGPPAARPRHFERDKNEPAHDDERDERRPQEPRGRAGGSRATAPSYEVRVLQRDVRLCEAEVVEVRLDRAALRGIASALAAGKVRVEVREANALRRDEGGEVRRP